MASFWYEIVLSYNIGFDVSFYTIMIYWVVSVSAKNLCIRSKLMSYLLVPLHII